MDYNRMERCNDNALGANHVCIQRFQSVIYPLLKALSENDACPLASSGGSSATFGSQLEQFHLALVHESAHNDVITIEYGGPVSSGADMTIVRNPYGYVRIGDGRVGHLASTDEQAYRLLGQALLRYMPAAQLMQCAVECGCDGQVTEYLMNKPAKPKRVNWVQWAKQMFVPKPAAA